MKPQHIIDWAPAMIAQHEKDLKKCEDAHAEAVRLYEALPLWKRLYTFRPASFGDRVYLNNYWIRELTAVLHEAKYSAKMGYGSMELSVNCRQLFFKWANDTGVPY